MEDSKDGSKDDREDDREYDSKKQEESKSERVVHEYLSVAFPCREHVM